MTYREIRQTALRQSAVDCGCRPEDFLQERPVIVESAPNRNARKYLDLPFVCDLVSYGSNVVASIDGRYRELVAGYLERFPAEHCFETPALHVLDDAPAAAGKVNKSGCIPEGQPSIGDPPGQ